MPRASASDVVSAGSMLIHSDEWEEKLVEADNWLEVDLILGMFCGTLLLDAPNERLLVRGLRVLGTTMLRGRRVEAAGKVRIEWSPELPELSWSPCTETDAAVERLIVSELWLLSSGRAR